MPQKDKELWEKFKRGYKPTLAEMVIINRVTLYLWSQL